jgi:mercuric ion transport protein
MRRTTNKVAGYALAATALIACPCHLALTLPLAIALLGGTAFGAALAAHTGLLVALATAYFAVALAAAIYLLSRSSR